MRPTAYLWSPALQAAADDLPANLGRSRAVHSLIRALRLTRTPDEPANDAAALVVPPDLALGTGAELARYHAPGYVEYLLQARGESSDEEESDSDDEGPRKKRRTVMGLEHDCPPFASLPAYATLVAAATLTACRLLATGDARTAIVWDGGRHHALKSRASGFCYVADAVLGILALTRAGVPAVPVPAGGDEAGEAGGEDGQVAEDDADDGDRPPTPPPPPKPSPRARILYLDLDLHYGDGVAQAFASPTHYAYPLKGRPRPPQVLTLSVHHAARGFFPPHAPGTTPQDTPHPFSLSLGLGAYASCATYARLWGAVERIKAAFRPHYVVLQLGVDGLPRDPVGGYGAWGVSGEGSSTWVVERVKEWDLPTCVLGGGGYDTPNAARSWALATAVLVGRADVREETDVPDHEGFEAYAPGYTLEVEPSHIPDENTEQQLDAADEAFAVLATRIAQIVDLHDKP
ncbi:Histone deacetylase 8 [Vanrija pseudolonga]|uniref:Histone deacetylase 8 n=1 Tax=Vanrija pseudolonga TaxID=143232 RepID=A0AAF0YCN6_9TREE|nr:Histone deacetylase 8 [Vanrija pseudolonga]